MEVTGIVVSPQCRDFAVYVVTVRNIWRSEMFRIRAAVLTTVLARRERSGAGGDKMHRAGARLADVAFDLLFVRGGAMVSSIARYIALGGLVAERENKIRRPLIGSSTLATGLCYNGSVESSKAKQQNSQSKGPLAYAARVFARLGG